MGARSLRLKQAGLPPTGRPGLWGRLGRPAAARTRWPRAGTAGARSVPPGGPRPDTPSRTTPGCPPGGLARSDSHA